MLMSARGGGRNCCPYFFELSVPAIRTLGPTLFCVFALPPYPHRQTSQLGPGHRPADHRQQTPEASQLDSIACHDGACSSAKEAAFWREKAELLQRELFRERLEAAQMREADLGLSSSLAELRVQVASACVALGKATGCKPPGLPAPMARGGLSDAAIQHVQRLTRALQWIASAAQQLQAGQHPREQQNGPEAHRVRLGDSSKGLLAPYQVCSSWRGAVGNGQIPSL